MTVPDLVRLFLEPLGRAGIGYVVTGGVASIVYGDPRFTRDVDLVLDLGPTDAGQLGQAFDASVFYLPPEEVVAEELARPEGGHFNIIHSESALRADVYPVGDVELHRWALGRARELAFGSVKVCLAPIEYVILRKLQYWADSGADRHERDVRMMLAVSGELIDEAELGRWVEELGLGEVWGRFS